MSIVSRTDFATGKYLLAVNRFTEDNLDTFISKYERRYLIKLLGAELYSLFSADLTGTPSEPQEERFTVIFEEGQWDLVDNEPTISDGIKEMLKGIIYYHYVRDNNMYHTITGLVSNNNENSNAEVKEKGAQYITALYAAAIETYNAIQQYISYNSDDYSEYKGEEIQQSPMMF